jgi:hypothetical protein
MRRLPVYSDRFWELKPRRNELRAAAPPDWLQATGYGIVVPPTFAHGIPDGWRERWRLIREFTERWHKKPMPDVGGRLEEIREVELRLGRTLPPSVREWVAFGLDAGTPNKLNIFPDTIRINELEGRVAISLLMNQRGEHHWAVRHADSGLPDPPVFGFHNFQVAEYDRRGSGAEPEEYLGIAPAVTSCVLGYTMASLRGKFLGLLRVVRHVDLLLPQLESAFLVHSRIDGVRLFEADDMFVRLNDRRGSAEQGTLQVAVAREFPRRAIPKFLRGRGEWYRRSPADPDVPF